MSDWPSSLLNDTYTISALPAHCQPLDLFLTRLSTNFDVCVPTYQAFISTLLGSLSILAWLFAQLPQIYKNYRMQSTAGLSVYFLIEWCLGDTTNLIGAILTNQATWQIIVAGYYTFVDCVLVGQLVWYERMREWRETKGLIIEGRSMGEDGYDSSEDDAARRRLVDGLSSTTDQDDALGAKKSGGTPFISALKGFKFPSLSSSYREKDSQLSTSDSNSPTDSTSSSRPIVHRVRNAISPTPSPRAVLLLAMLCAVLTKTQASSMPPPPPLIQIPSLRPLFHSESSESYTELAGRILSWVSTALYLGSRIPQLVKNAQRRSTAGLSLSLFVAAFFGNLFYSSSLLTNPLAWSDFGSFGGRGWAPEEGSSRWRWVSLAAPFWLGAAGVLVLDAAVGMQFLMYREKGREEEEERMMASMIESMHSMGGVGGWGGVVGWRRVSGWMRGWVPSWSLMLVARGEVEDGDVVVEEVDDDEDTPLLERDDFR